MNKDNTNINLGLRAIGKITLVTAVYFLANFLVFLLISSQNLIPLIWPQAGVALAAILLVGFDALPGILIGSFLTAVATGVPISNSVIVAVGGSLAAFFPAYYILTKNNFSNALENVRSIFGIIILGVLFGPAISATINLIGMYLMQINIGGSLLLAWETKWLQDALGVLIFTPFILVWFGNPLPKITINQLMEGVPIYFAAAGLSLFILFGKLNRETANSIVFLIIPIIIWASMKLNIHGLISINLIISVLFLWGAANQQGALFNEQIFSNLTILFVFGTTWITSLIISSSITKLQKTQENLSELSNHDQLTHLYNRLFFDTEMDRLEKSRQFPISIVMSDMDNLKQVNDIFGHSAGDEVLKNIALLLSLSFRQEDIVSRIGGDEFAVLLPNTGAPEVKMIIERMNNRIDSYNTKNLDHPINISLGVSTADQGDSLNSHLKIADNLMYADKQEHKQRNVTRFIDKIKVNE